MPLSFTKRRFDASLSILEVALNGVVTLSDALVLQKSLRHTLQQGYSTIAVNLRNVREIDPSAWDCLMATARRLHHTHGRVILRHCPDSLFAQLRKRQWDECFLLPERRSADVAALPIALREWAVGCEDPEDATGLPLRVNR